MAKDKRSFFERLTGAVRMDDKEASPAPKKNGTVVNGHKLAIKGDGWMEETESEGELTVDVYQTPEMIVVKSMIAGVRPEDLDVSITRDLVTIRGHREEERVAQEGDYLVKELYWGSFSRSVELPEEIDVDESEAVEKHGLLILKLPRLDKKRESKLKVKTV
jgi:HSP20 family molecular chaperone IbpA